MMSPEDTEKKWQCCPLWHRKFHNKWNSRIFATRHGCYVPEIYWKGSHPEEIPFESLPSRYVVKPIFNSGGNQNVYVLVDGLDIMRNQTYSHRKLTQELIHAMSWKRTWHRRAPLMVQEFVDGGESGRSVSHEYKIHMFGDTVGAIQAVKRKDNQTASSAFYSEHWNLFDSPMYEDYEHAPYQSPVAYLDQVISVAKRMGHSLGTYARLDFMLTETEFYFGEMTMTPCGPEWTAYAENYFDSLLEGLSQCHK